jgi:hypothetical protein
VSLSAPPLGYCCLPLATFSEKSIIARQLVLADGLMQLDALADDGIFIAQQRLRQYWWAASAAARQAARPTPAVDAVHAAAAAVAAASQAKSQRKFCGRTIPCTWSPVALRTTGADRFGNLMLSAPLFQPVILLSLLLVARGRARPRPSYMLHLTCCIRPRTDSRKRIATDRLGPGTR